MEQKLILVYCVTLLFRESQLSEDKRDKKTIELINAVISRIKIGNINIGIHSERDCIIGLKNTIQEMLCSGLDSSFDSAALIQRIMINSDNDEKLIDVLKEGIVTILTEDEIMKRISYLRNLINQHYREEEVKSIISTAFFKLREVSNQPKEVEKIVLNLRNQLEPFEKVNQKTKDDAVISELDLGDEEGTSALFNEAAVLSVGDGILKTGWQRLNKMLQGGFRRGEFCTIGALQHEYKTSLSLSIFKQIALYNKPHMLDVNRKPLLLRISFEDDLYQNISYLYKLLKYEETKKPISIKRVSKDELAYYTKKRLQVNGYHIKMMRVNPSSWAYRDIFDKIIELESYGYEIHLLGLDYLSMISKAGCTTGGPMGTDLRDLFRRVRNFCGPKKITCITPHQLSTDAKNLTRNGVPDDQFVKEIIGKGYWADSKQLDQEMDLEIAIKIARRGDSAFLTMQRGKHRGTEIIPESDKYFVLPFPKEMPIPDDINGTDSGFNKIPSIVNSEVLF